MVDAEAAALEAKESGQETTLTIAELFGAASLAKLF